MNPIFKKFCSLVTVDLFKIMEASIGEEINYEEDELESLANAHETIREDVFLDDVFGHHNRLENADFLKGIVNKAPYMFEPQ